MNLYYRSWPRPLYWYQLFFLLFTVNSNAFGQELPSRIAKLINSAKSKGMLSGAGAVILKKQITVFAETNGECIYQKEIVGIVMDKTAASDYSQISDAYNAHYQSVSLDYARTYAKNRDVLSVSQDAVQIKTPHNLNGTKTYSDIRKLTFSLPGMAPETIFEYKISIKCKPAIKNNWAFAINFHEILSAQDPNQISRVDPVLQSEVFLDMPNHQRLKYDLSNTVITPTIKKIKERISFSWMIKNLEKIELEQDMPTIDHFMPAIAMSSIENWKIVDKWAFNRYAPNYSENRAIVNLVQGITRQATNRIDKIKAVYNYVQSNIEYVLANFGRSGYRPHPASKVFENGYGDCKDQTVLVISMLKVLGVKAYPALLVPFPFKNVNKKVPSYFFNHVIVYIPQPTGDIWIDTTSNSKFSYLSWPDQDRSAFVIDGKGGYFKKTPLMPLARNQGTIKTTYHISGDDLALDMQITASGALGDSLKAIFSILTLQQREQSIRSWVTNLYPNSEVLLVNTSDMKDSEIEFQIDVAIRFIKTMDEEVDHIPIKIDFSTALGFFTKLLSLPRPEDRKYDYLEGFACQLSAEWSFAPADSSYVLSVYPEEKRIDSECLSFNTEYKKENDSVRVRSSLIVKNALIRKENYPDFYTTIRDLLSKGKNVIVFKKQKIDKKTFALENKLKESPDDVKNQLDLCKQYLKTGRYEEARRLLDKAIEADKANGELFYYLGIALGYLGQYDLADEEIEKSKELGYFP